MNYPKMTLFNNLWKTNIVKQCVRTYIKRKYPIDPKAADDLPVHQYPIRKESENLVYVWGLAEHGALGQYLQKAKKMRGRGDRRFGRFQRPLRLQFGELHMVTGIAAGYGFTAFAVKSVNNVKVFGTGINTDSQIGYHDPRRDAPLGLILSPVPITLPLSRPTTTRVSALSAGRAHLAVVTDQEGVFLLGNNAYGQCGRTVVKEERYSGSRVVHHIPELEGQKIINVECGQDHTLFLTELGHVFSCGLATDGQTGQGHYQSSNTPQRVLGDIEGERITQLSSKGDCVLALSEKGEVFGWGNSEYSQILSQEDERQQVNRAVLLNKCRGFGKILGVAAAGSYCLILNEDGEVMSWGYGILGRGPAASHAWEPTRIPPILFGRNEFQPLSRVVSVHCGMHHSAAITNQGDVFVWGKNTGGCLGLGHMQDQFFPLRVAIAAQAKTLSLGVDHSVAICKVF